jgi:hypothetical protein
MLTNQERVLRCQTAIAKYGDDVLESNLTDFLADARHWCDEHGESYAELDHVAYKHYLAEFVEGLRRRS